ncbi:DUF887-domain-containing protein [Polychaeton citri CBS 116435]|uniref:DUF887-domain-containing protein n=1 Tax=Polychaeton citri CBS 116435 TaxID=1314669 RepID=A0A9P4UPD5_9PEZI|nr:DUF887-domain-containing protein [Polychaeton citri CBS 116435]
MKDPFPIGPPAFLVEASKPLCDAVGLTALPLHIHEVIFAAGLYTVLQTVVSPALSKAICPGIYNKFDKRTVINWNVHVVSFFQSCIICGLALYALIADPEVQDWRRPESWEKRLWAYDGMIGFVQAMAYGYFIWDIYLCIRYIHIFGVGMLAHAMSAVSVFSFGFRPFVGYYAPVFLLYELSSPFLNIHWFCDKVGLTGTIYQAINGTLLAIVFFSCRLVWGVWNSYHVFYDVRTAQAAGYGEWGFAQTVAAKEAEMLKGQGFYEKYTGLRFTNIDIATGDVTGYMAPVKYAPLWLGGAYLAANMTLNVLNVYWFTKMIETIRSRFPPPFGTKGTGSKKNKQEFKARKGSVSMDEISKYMGEGEVPMDGKVNGEKIQASDVTKSVYADGSTSLEVGGKSLRSRRKA